MYNDAERASQVIYDDFTLDENLRYKLQKNIN